MLIGKVDSPESIVGMNTPPETDASKSEVKIAERTDPVPFRLDARTSPPIRHMRSDYSETDVETCTWNYACALPSSNTDDETDWMLRENRAQIFFEEIYARKSDIDFTDKDSTPEVRERSGKDLANQLKERIKGLQDRKCLNAELLGPGLLDFAAFAKERIANWEGKYGRLVDHNVHLKDVILAPHQVTWLEQLNNEGQRQCEEVIRKQRDEKARVQMFREYPLKPVDITLLDTNVQVIFYLVKLHHFMQAMGEQKTIAQFLVERFDELWRAYPSKTLRELLRDTLQMLPESISEMLPNKKDRKDLMVAILSKTDF